MKLTTGLVVWGIVTVGALSLVVLPPKASARSTAEVENALQ